jgi:DHA2 family multidrug resistance protein-like MFS transporter
VAFAAPFAGRLSDRYRAGILSTIGLGVMAVGLALYAALPLHPSWFEIVLHGLVCGVGFGFFQAPNNRELIGSAPRSKTGSAAGVLASMRLTGQTTGAALVAIVFGTLGTAVAGGSEHTENVVRAATPVALWIACGCAALGAVVSGMRLLAAPRAASPEVVSRV